jgi:hypothetical protein
MLHSFISTTTIEYKVISRGPSLAAKEWTPRVPVKSLWSGMDTEKMSTGQTDSDGQYTPVRELSRLPHTTSAWVSEACA